MRLWLRNWHESRDAKVYGRLWAVEYLPLPCGLNRHVRIERRSIRKVRARLHRNHGTSPTAFAYTHSAVKGL